MSPQVTERQGSAHGLQTPVNGNTAQVGGQPVRTAFPRQRLPQACSSRVCVRAHAHTPFIKSPESPPPAGIGPAGVLAAGQAPASADLREGPTSPVLCGVQGLRPGVQLEPEAVTSGAPQAQQPSPGGFRPPRAPAQSPGEPTPGGVASAVQTPTRLCAPDGAEAKWPDAVPTCPPPRPAAGGLRSLPSRNAPNLLCKLGVLTAPPRAALRTETDVRCPAKTVTSAAAHRPGHALALSRSASPAGSTPHRSAERLWPPASCLGGCGRGDALSRSEPGSPQRPRRRPAGGRATQESQQAPGSAKQPPPRDWKVPQPSPLPPRGRLQGLGLREASGVNQAGGPAAWRGDPSDGRSGTCGRKAGPAGAPGGVPKRSLCRELGQHGDKALVPSGSPPLQPRLGLGQNLRMQLSACVPRSEPTGQSRWEAGGGRSRTGDRVGQGAGWGRRRRGSQAAGVRSQHLVTEGGS